LFANLLGVSASPRSVHVERGGRVPCSSSVIPGSGGRRRARTRFFVSMFSEAARLAVSERGLQLDRRPRFDAELDHFEEGLIGASPHGRAEAPNQRAASNAEHDGLVKQEAVVPAVRCLGVPVVPRLIRGGRGEIGPHRLDVSWCRTALRHSDHGLHEERRQPARSARSSRRGPDRGVPGSARRHGIESGSRGNPPAIPRHTANR
jgi:hypothetical protein